MKRQWLVAASSLVAALAFGCGGKEAAPEAQGHPVVTAGVTISDVEDRIAATGELQARDEAAVAAEVPGQITDVLVEEGQPVEAGQVVLEIDPQKRELELANARASLSEAQAALAEAGRNQKRWKVLHEQNIAADARMDEVETALVSARSHVDSAAAMVGVAERALHDASVRAPFGGYLARRKVSRGEFVQIGQPLFDLVALDPIEVEFHLSERDSARVAAGQGVALTVEPYPGETFRGEVTVVSPMLDPKTRTLRVQARVANADARLRPGLFARVDLGVALRKNLLLVPEESVLQRADGEIVYRTKADDRVERVEVKTGVHRDGMVEIASGLAAEDVVVTRGQAGLVDGALVSPRNTDGSLLRTDVSARERGQVVR